MVAPGAIGEAPEQDDEEKEQELDAWVRESLEEYLRKFRERS